MWKLQAPNSKLRRSTKLQTEAISCDDHTASTLIYRETASQRIGRAGRENDHDILRASWSVGRNRKRGDHRPLRCVRNIRATDGASERGAGNRRVGWRPV